MRLEITQMTDYVLQLFGVILVVRSAGRASLSAVNHLAVELVGFDLEIVEDLRHRAAQMLLDLAKQLEKKRKVSAWFDFTENGFNWPADRSENGVSSPRVRCTKCSSHRSP